MELTPPVISVRQRMKLKGNESLIETKLREDGSFRYLIIGGVTEKLPSEKNSFERAFIGVFKLDRDMELVFEHIFEDSAMKSINVIRVISDWTEKETNPALLINNTKYTPPPPKPSKPQPSSEKNPPTSKSPQKSIPPTKPGQVQPTPSPQPSPDKSRAVELQPLASHTPHGVTPSTRSIDVVAAVGNSLLIMAVNVDVDTLTLLHGLDSCHVADISDLCIVDKSIITVSQGDKIVNIVNHR